MNHSFKRRPSSYLLLNSLFTTIFKMYHSKNPREKGTKMLTLDRGCG